ncbi:MAG: type IVB secretion system protein IcmW [Legionellaceae bacterium]|nr:type IVB secretion system protein IcmW [Legionellaceae bacterium]
MPDLSHEASLAYWKDFVDPMIYRVIVFLESVEDFTLDGDAQVEDAMQRLGQELDDIDKVDLSALGRQDLFVRIAANIKSGRGLRLLQAIDSVHPGSASQVIVHAEENSFGTHNPANVFLKRNIVFERLRLLSRIFSHHRLEMVSRALEGGDE